MDTKKNLMKNKQILTQFSRVMKKYSEKYGDKPITPSKLDVVIKELIFLEKAKIETENGDE